MQFIFPPLFASTVLTLNLVYIFTVVEAKEDWKMIIIIICSAIFIFLMLFIVVILLARKYRKERASGKVTIIKKQFINSNF